jgi:signal transduction histidine kinase
MIIPTATAYFVLNRAISHVFNLGFNPAVMTALETSKANLKKLKGLDPQHEQEYKREFDSNIELLQVYSDLPTLKQEIFNPIKLFYLILIGVSTVMAILASVIVSRKISRAYRSLLKDLMKAQERVQYLDKISSWQILIRSLAHEIKNPLTPIEVMSTNIKKSYLQLPPSDFMKLLEESEQVISEEVGHIRKLLSQFNDLSKIPEPIKHQVDFFSFIQLTINQFQIIYPQVIFNLIDELTEKKCVLQIDESLIKQVVTNIINNAIEANNTDINSPLQIQFQLNVIDNEFILRILNNGICVPERDIPLLFEPHFSTKKSKLNMGLGLSISKKIMLDHNGDINYEVIDDKPVFKLSFEFTNIKIGV